MHINSLPKAVITSCFIMCCLLSHAQFNTSTPTDTVFTTPWKLHFNPLALADIGDPNISGGIEYRNNNKALHLDAGYIFTSVYHTSKRAAQPYGYYFRPAYRKYNKTSSTKSNFWELRGGIKQVWYTITDWVDKDLVNGVPAYQSYETFTLKKIVLNANFIAGTQHLLNTKGKTIIEYYVGCGLRYKTFPMPLEGGGIYSDINLITAITDADGNTNNAEVLIDIKAGIRLVFPRKKW
ncbi:MAG: hypothetical protein RLZZ316_1137 [Bacteroidota bacterium]|jgi:hypothetical protein